MEKEIGAASRSLIQWFSVQTDFLKVFFNGKARFIEHTHLASTYSSTRSDPAWLLTRHLLELVCVL